MAGQGKGRRLGWKGVKVPGCKCATEDDEDRTALLGAHAKDPSCARSPQREQEEKQHVEGGLQPTADREMCCNWLLLVEVLQDSTPYENPGLQPMVPLRPPWSRALVRQVLRRSSTSTEKGQDEAGKTGHFPFGWILLLLVLNQMYRGTYSFLKEH